MLEKIRQDKKYKLKNEVFEDILKFYKIREEDGTFKFPLTIETLINVYNTICKDIATGESPHVHLQTQSSGDSPNV